MKKTITFFLLFFSLGLHSMEIDSAKLSQIIYKGRLSFCHILDINEEALLSHHPEDMQFVVDIGNNYVTTVSHGINAGSSLTDQSIKDSLNARLAAIYQQYNVELYMVVINSLDVIIKSPLTQPFNSNEFFHSKLFDENTNVSNLKALQDSITSSILLTSIAGHNRDCIVFSSGQFCGAFGSDSTKKGCFGHISLSVHHGAENNYAEISSLLRYYSTTISNDNTVIHAGDNYSLPEAVEDFRRSVQYIHLRSQIATTWTNSGLDDIFEDFATTNDFESLSISDRIHSISVYTGIGMGEEQELNSLKILENTPDDQLHELFEFLSAPTPLKDNPAYMGLYTDNAVIYNLISGIDDGITGGNNYTSLITIIAKLEMKNSAISNEHLPVTAEQKFNSTFYWDDSYLFTCAPVGSHNYDVSLNSNGTLDVNQQVCDRNDVDYNNSAATAHYTAHWNNNYSPVHFNPFDLVAFTNRSNLSMLQQAGAQQKEVIIVPAIFLKYADDKSFNHSAVQVSVSAVLVVSTALGPGAIFSAVEATNIAVAAYESLQFLGNAASLVAENSNDPDVMALVDKYNAIIGIWGLSHIVTTGTQFTANYFASAANGELHTIPLATAQDFENSFTEAGTKIDALSADAKGKLKGMEEYFEGKVGVLGNLTSNISFVDFANTVDEFKNGANAALAQQSYNLFKEQKWAELEELFNNHNINGGWPPNNGAISVQNKILIAGKEFDRYGGWIDNSGFHDNGFFASPTEVPFEQRALPQSSLQKPYKKYRVLIPFEVEEGEIIPWFNEPGMGTQFKFPETIDNLKQNGFIEEIQ